MNNPDRKRQEESLTPAQAYFITSMKKFLWFCAGRGSGKCLKNDTMIEVHDISGGGLIRADEVSKGLFLKGPDGLPREVLSITSGYDEMFEILPEDPMIKPYTVNRPHILTVLPYIRDDYYRWTLNGFNDVSTKYIDAIDISIDQIITENEDYYNLSHTFQIKPETQEIIRSSTFDIIPKGIGKYYGFELSGDGRFLLEGGTVTHNTRIGSRWVYKNVLKYPRARGMIAANTYNQLHSATLPPVLAYFREMGLEYRVNKRPPESWLRRSPVELAEYKNVLTTETGAHIFLRSLDNYDYIRGIEFGWAWIDEISSTNKDAWDVIVGCLRDPECEDRMIRVTGTPDGDNWTWREFEKKWSKDPIISKMYDIVFMSSRENPFLPEEFLDMMLASYDRRTALQEIDGRVLIDNESLIYYEWRPKYHMKQIKPYDPNLPLIMCWDFNSSDSSPMSMVLAQQHYYSDGTPFVQVIDEIIIMSGNTPMVCEEFTKRYNRKHNSEIYVYGDRTGTTNKSVGINDYGMIMECLSPYFPQIVMRNVKKNMGEKDRRAAMNSMLLNAKGQVRMFINPKCLELIKDFDELKPDKFGKINKSDLKRSHASDALGYYIAKEFPVVTKKQKSDADFNINLGLR